MAASIGAVGDRGLRSGGSGTESRARRPGKRSCSVKLLAAVALALVLIVAVVACFATSPSTPKIARSFSNPWTTYTIDTGVRFENSIALDSYDNVHISYYNLSAGSLMYATNVDGSWTTSTIDASSGQYAGILNSIAIDSAGKVHMIYTAQDKTTWTFFVKYATNIDGSWAISTIDSPGVTGSIAIDSADSVHISYTNHTVLRYATNAGGSWVICKIDNMPIRYSSIALDSADNVHICSGGALSLGYATNASGSWVASTADYVDAVYTSLALDSAGQAHISYVSNNPDVVKYATNVGGSWTNRTIGPTRYPLSFPFGVDTSIALDSNDEVHISYYDARIDNHYLKYATNIGGTWTDYTIESGAGDYNCIALDSENNVHISYDFAASAQKYATNAELVIPEFGTAGVVVVIIAAVCIFVALRWKLSPSSRTKEE